MHQTIRAGALLVLEDDSAGVVLHEPREGRAAARDPTFERSDHVGLRLAREEITDREGSGAGCSLPRQTGRAVPFRLARRAPEERAKPEKRDAVHFDSSVNLRE